MNMFTSRSLRGTRFQHLCTIRARWVYMDPERYAGPARRFTFDVRRRWREKARRMRRSGGRDKPGRLRRLRLRRLFIF